MRDIKRVETFGDLEPHGTEQRCHKARAPIDPPAGQKLEDDEEQKGAEHQRAELRVDAAPGRRKGVGQEQRSGREDHRQIGELGNGPGAILLGVKYLVQGRTQSSEHTSREPEEQGRGEQREAATTRDEVAERAFDEFEGVGRAFIGIGKKALQQLVDVELVNGDLILDEIANDGEDQADEGDGGEQDVERDRAGEKWDVVFVGGFESTTDDAGDRAMPAAFTSARPIHASGSSSSSDAGATGGVGRAARLRRRRAASRRRRSCSRVAISGSSSSSSSGSSPSSSASFRSPRTSSTFSSASSFRLRSPLPTR